MKVSLIIPTLNEEGCIERVINEVPKDLVHEIIVVDKSTDDTPNIARRLGCKVIEQTGKGFGNAFATGVKHSVGDVCILMDGDGSHNPTDIPLLIEKYKQGYDYVMACRYLPNAGSDDDTAVRSFGNWLFTRMVNLVHGIKVSDSLYLYSLIDRNLYNMLNITSQGFEYCIELLVKVHKTGARIAEVPSAERRRFGGTPKTHALIHGWPILLEIFKRVAQSKIPYRSLNAQSVITKDITTNKH